MRLNSIRQTLMEAERLNAHLPFVKGCSEFYKKNGYLSIKQLAALKKIAHSPTLIEKAYYE